MTQILSKIGKVVSLIRREGFVSAFRRVITFVAGSLHRVGSGQILYINGGLGDNALYRGRHIVEELQQRGFVAEATIQDNPFLRRYINRFDVFVLHRVVCSGHMLRFIAAAKEAGKVVVFETDDLVFDGNLMSSTSAYANMNAFERTQYEGGLSSCVVEDPYVEYATTTTEPLARHLRAKGKEVFVVPNKISQSFVEIAKSAREYVAQESCSDDIFRIGYFSGSASHDRDFMVITDVLLDILEKYKFVELFLAGPLDLDNRFDVYNDRVVRAPYVTREEHFVNVARCNVNVAPLEIGDAYCEAKSEIKYYEAGVVGVPTIASATEVFTSAIDGKDVGFVAKDAQEWRNALEEFINNPDLVKKMGERAKQDVLENHTTFSQQVPESNEQFYDFLRESIDGSFDRYTSSILRSVDVDTAVVIVNWNGRDYLRTCLESLRNQSDQSFHVIVVDNGSDDGSLNMLREEYSDVSWIALSKNMGFAHPTNCGIRMALKEKTIKNVITLNNDASCDQEYIAVMREAAQQASCNEMSIGALQPKVLNYYHKDCIDTTGMVTSFDLSALNRGKDEVDVGQYDNLRDIFGPSASAALYTRKSLEDTMLPYAGYFDRSYFAYYEDVDLAWRLCSAGYDVQFVPDAKVYHVHSATGGNNSSFKAYHIHRNHFYNVIKNAPWFYLPALAFFLPIRYVLVTISLFGGKGPAARLDETAKEAKTEGAFSIVVRSWCDVFYHLPHLLSKRRCIMHKRKRSHLAFFKMIRDHYITLKQFIFR